MMVLITYDVNTEDSGGRKRLRQIAKQCVNYGQRVQNSVFECLLDAAQCKQLQHKLLSIMDKEKDRSHPARGAWIEIVLLRIQTCCAWSHPARGAWIEIVWLDVRIDVAFVAPRKGCVD